MTLKLGAVRHHPQYAVKRRWSGSSSDSADGASVEILNFIRTRAGDGNQQRTESKAYIEFDLVPLRALPQVRWLKDSARCKRLIASRLADREAARSPAS